MAQKTDQQQEQSGPAQARGPQQANGDQTQRMESAASRIGSAARAGARAEGEAVRQGGQEIARSAADTARASQRMAEHGGEVARQSIDTMEDNIREIVETGADQFDRIGEMMAEAARDAAENIRMMMSLSTMTADSLRGFQHASSGMFERLARTNMRAAQSLVEQANPGGIAAFQQRFFRNYLEAMTEGSAELLRAAQQMTDEALRPLEQARGRSGGERPRRRGGAQQGPAVSDVMSPEVRLVQPDDTVQQAARLMGEGDLGVLPVAEGDRLVGMVTDRDIAIRLAAEGRDPANTPVREVMTREVKYCFEDESLDQVAANMAEQQLHRLPVMNRDKRLVGILSLGDLAEHGQHPLAERALAGISRHTGRHSQKGANR